MKESNELPQQDSQLTDLISNLLGSLLPTDSADSGPANQELLGRLSGLEGIINSAIEQSTKAMVAEEKGRSNPDLMHPHKIIN